MTITEWAIFLSGLSGALTACFGIWALTLEGRASRTLDNIERDVNGSKFERNAYIAHVKNLDLDVKTLGRRLAEQRALRGDIDRALGMVDSLKADVKVLKAYNKELVNRVMTLHGEMKSTHTIINSANSATEAPMSIDPILKKLQEDLGDIMGVPPVTTKNPDSLV